MFLPLNDHPERRRKGGKLQNPSPFGKVFRMMVLYRFLYSIQRAGNDAHFMHGFRAHHQADDLVGRRLLGEALAHFLAAPHHDDASS